MIHFLYKHLARKEDTHVFELHKMRMTLKHYDDEFHNITVSFLLKIIQSEYKNAIIIFILNSFQKQIFKLTYNISNIIVISKRSFLVIINILSFRLYDPYKFQYSDVLFSVCIVNSQCA